MPPQAIDALIALIILGVTYALASEGLWGASLMFFNVLFAGLITFNFYEYLAAQLANTGYLTGFADTLCLMLTFTVTVLLLRMATETIAPSMVRFPNPVYHIGRWVFGLATAMMTMAILLVAFETAPVHKKVFGTIDYKSQPPFGLALDRKWLALFQYTTGQVFAAHTGKREPFLEYGDANVFDPRAEWLLRHQEARPYGTESVLEEGGGGGAGAAPGGAAPGGGAAGGGGGNPNDVKVIGPAVGGGVVIPN